MSAALFDELVDAPYDVILNVEDPKCGVVVTDSIMRCSIDSIIAGFT